MATEPTDAIAKGIKPYLKNQNKYILGLSNLIFAEVYGRHPV